MCVSKFVLCLFGDRPCLCTICHSWQHAGILHLSIQGDGNYCNVVFPLIVYENTYACLSVVCLGVIQHLATSYQFTEKVHSISNICPRRITVAIVQTCPIICIQYLCMYAFIYVYFRIPIRSSVTSYGGSGCARARKDASETTCHCAAGFSEQTVTATTQSVTDMTRRPSTSY